MKKRLTDEELLAELAYVLDLSGFYHNIAYDVIGLSYPGYFLTIENPGKRQAMRENIEDMLACLMEALATGNYPESIERDRESDQIKELYNNWVLANKQN